MATHFAVFQPTLIRASSSSVSGKSEPNRRKSVTTNWWTPIFGWSSEPEYVGSYAVEPVQNADPQPENGRIKARFTPGCFTEEKAKLLRKKTLESSTFHDIMYHSAIASRLASDLNEKIEK